MRPLISHNPLQDVVLITSRSKQCGPECVLCVVKLIEMLQHVSGAGTNQPPAHVPFAFFSDINHKSALLLLL